MKEVSNFLLLWNYMEKQNVGDKYLQIASKLVQKFKRWIVDTHATVPTEKNPEFFGRDGKLRGVKRQCYEGGIRVPFIVKWPAKIQLGTVNDYQLSFYDIMSTFCEIIGDNKKFPMKYANNDLEGDCFDGFFSLLH